jgi:hypothetical protein
MRLTALMLAHIISAWAVATGVILDRGRGLVAQRDHERVVG